MGTSTTLWEALDAHTANSLGNGDLHGLGFGPQIVRTGFAVEVLRRADLAGPARMMTEDEQADGRKPPVDGVRDGTLDGVGEGVLDEDLMLAFRAGDASAFEQLVSRHKRGLYNFLLRSVHNHSRAEELLQEVFLRVIRAKDRYQRTARFTTWVYTIARNLCVDESRRQKFRRTVPLEAKRRGRGEGSGTTVLDVTEAEQIDTDAASEAPKIRDRVADAIANLPDDQREVFVMRQFGGLSFKQIGEAVGAPENTVKSRMRYALEKLRGDLKDIDPRATEPEAQVTPPRSIQKATASG